MPDMAKNETLTAALSELSATIKDLKETVKQLEPDDTDSAEREPRGDFQQTFGKPEPERMKREPAKATAYTGPFRPERPVPSAEKGIGTKILEFFGL